MQSDLFGAFVAAAGGFALGALNYCISKFVLKKHPAHFSSVTVLRQSMQVLYLVLLFVLGDRTPWNKLYLMVGGVVGFTLAIVWFTHRLVRMNEEIAAKSTGKEESQDG